MSKVTPIKEIVDSKIEKLEKVPEEQLQSKLHCDTCGKDTHNTEGHGKRGGARKGGGMPKGKLTKKKLEQIQVREAFNQRVMLHADRLFNAQMNLAVGEQSLFVKVKERDSKGKVIRVTHEVITDVETIKQYLDYEEGLEGAESLNDENHYYYLSTKPADNKAIDSLLNRALGKAPDKLEITGGFFSQSQLTIKVVGSDHDVIDIGEDGQLAGSDSGTDPVGETGPSGQDSQPPASS